MGGQIALQVARRWPDRVRRLVVVDSAGIIFDSKAPQPPFPQNEQEFLRLMTPKPSSLPSFVVRDILRRNRADAQNFVLQRALRNRNKGTDFLDGQMQTVNMPVLIIWGEQDLLTPVSWANALHQQISQSTLVILQGCGHIALYDCRPQVLPQIRNFLSSANPESGGLRSIPPE
jgi:pimeloyl-ACP methyl ester carboxylesterase